MVDIALSVLAKLRNKAKTMGLYKTTMDLSLLR